MYKAPSLHKLRAPQGSPGALPDCALLTRSPRQCTERASSGRRAKPRGPAPSEDRRLAEGRAHASLIFVPPPAKPGGEAPCRKKGKRS